MYAIYIPICNIDQRCPNDFILFIMYDGPLIVVF